MKRSWIGFFLLILLLAGGILSTWAMGAIHEPIEAKLLQAAEISLQGDWDTAGQLFRTAEQDWQRTERFRSCFADHNPVEEIDAEFLALKVCCSQQDTVSFAAGCSSLARQVAAVGEAHELVWWNLL